MSEVNIEGKAAWAAKTHPIPASLTKAHCRLPFFKDGQHVGTIKVFASSAVEVSLGDGKTKHRWDSETGPKDMDARFHNAMSLVRNADDSFPTDEFLGQCREALDQAKALLVK